MRLNTTIVALMLLEYTLYFDIQVVMYLGTLPKSTDFILIIKID